MINALKEVVAPDLSIVGNGRLNAPLSLDWTHKDVNVNDPVEEELAVRLHSHD